MPRPTTLPPNLPPRGLTREQAAQYVGLGEDLFTAQVKAGKLPQGLELGGRRVWDRVALDRALDVLSGLAETDEAPSLGKQAALEAIRGSL